MADTLADFQRDASPFLARLKKTGRPIVLAAEGEEALVVQDAISYRKLVDQADRAETLDAIKRGLESLARGEGRPIDKFFDELENDLKTK